MSSLFLLSYQEAQTLVVDAPVMAALDSRCVSDQFRLYALTSSRFAVGLPLVSWPNIFPSHRYTGFKDLFECPKHPLLYELPLPLWCLRRINLNSAQEHFNGLPQL